MIVKITDFLNGIIWSDWMTYLCLLTGFVFTIALFGEQLKLKEMWSLLFHTKSSSEGISGFQAFTMAVGGRVGTGNIVGVATAIAYGGPGAMFWMWLLALLGAATTFAECSLSQLYKKKIDGIYRGGPAYYIRYGLRSPWLAAIFAAAAFIGNAILHPGLQADAISTAVNNAFGLNKLITGIIIVVLLALIIFGGVRRIGNVASKVVPVMAGIYILASLVLLVVNAKAIPACFSLIFTSAFGANSVFGGILGSAIAWGVKRGFYSSEAGMGTASQAAANADVSHPAKQGLVQSFSVYIDTIFVCTATGLMMLITGMYNVEDGAGGYLYEGLHGVEVGVGYVQAALDTLLPHFGSIFVAIALFFFAFTTLLAAYNIGETNFLYLFGKSKYQKAALTVVRILFLAVTFLGSMVPATLAWAWADIGLGSAAWITMIGALCLVPVARKLYRDYWDQKKQGLDPIFRPSRVGIKNAELWEEIADRYEAEMEATTNENAKS